MTILIRRIAFRRMYPARGGGGFRAAMASHLGLLLMWLLVAAPSDAQPVLTDLGTLPGGSSSAATAVNASGQVVGSALTADALEHAVSSGKRKSGMTLRPATVITLPAISAGRVRERLLC